MNQKHIHWIGLALPAGSGLMIGALGALGAFGPIADPVVYVRISLSLLVLCAGLLLSLLLLIRLTLRWRAARQTKRLLAQSHAQAADDRRRFLRRLDHELKNSLTAIRAGLANVVSESSAVLRHEIVGRIEAQAVHLSTLATDLRKLADIETRPLERTSFSLADLLQDVLTTLHEIGVPPSKKLTLHLPQVPWPLPPMSGDPDLLFLVFYNVVDNALKFTRPADTIEIRAFEDDAHVTVEVADTGVGIPEADLEHIWEELYRGQTARSIPGSGLGLTLVRTIVIRHGGQVRIRSRLDQGTIVTIRLPVAGLESV
jgi:two-component system OmpR family sensor kinase